MRLAVMGAGGVGGCLGALLARAGNDVSLITRGEHLKAIRDNGLKLIRPDEEFVVEVNSTDNPAQVGPVDLILNRFDVVFQDVALSATGWTLSPCGEFGRFRLGPTLSAIRRMVEYRLTGVKT